MAMIGIGLGGLAQGFERGVGLGDKMNKMNRERENEGRVDAARTAGEADFNAAVERGDAQPDDIASSIRFAAPYMMRAALQNNDPAMLKQFYDFSRSEEANVKAKAFEAGMSAFGAGDEEGALKIFQKLGGQHGYKFGEITPTQDGQFTMPVTTPDGRTVNPVFPNKQEFFARVANPAVMFQDWQRQRQRQEANGDDATRYGARKNIDLSHAKAQQEAGLGPSVYTPYTVETTDENGKPINQPRRFNNRTGELEPMPGIEGNGRLVRPTGAAGGTGSSRSPAEVRTAEWLVQNKIAATPDEAWSMVRTSRDSPTRLRAQMYNNALRAAYGDPERARQITEEGMRILWPQQTPPPASRTAVPQPQSRSGNPQRPQGVPPDAGYSPSAKRWFTRDGRSWGQDGQQNQ